MFSLVLDGGFTGNNDPGLALDYLNNFSLNKDHRLIMSHVRHTKQSSQNKHSTDISYNTAVGVLCSCWTNLVTLMSCLKMCVSEGLHLNYNLTEGILRIVSWQWDMCVLEQQIKICIKYNRTVKNPGHGTLSKLTLMRRILAARDVFIWCLVIYFFFLVLKPSAFFSACLHKSSVFLCGSFFSGRWRRDGLDDRAVWTGRRNKIATMCRWRHQALLAVDENQSCDAAIVDARQDWIWQLPRQNRHPGYESVFFFFSAHDLKVLVINFHEIVISCLKRTWPLFQDSSGAPHNSGICLSPSLSLSVFLSDFIALKA